MRSRLKLLLTTDANGGVWTYSLELAQALADADDVMVYLAVLGPSPAAEQMDAAAATPGTVGSTTRICGTCARSKANA